MKKIISVLLATILLASMVIPANASSYNDFLDIDEAEYDMDAYYADLWNNYNHNMHGLLWDYICGENYYVYTQAVKEVGNDAWIEFASRLTGEEMTQERYAEILVNLLAMMDYNTSHLIEDQVNADSTKTLSDYAIDATGIIVQGISLNTAFGSKITEPMKKVTTALNLTWGGAEFTINTIETFEHLDRLLQQYNNYNLFLNAIVENATDRELQAAANELMSVVDKTFFCKVDATTKVSGDLAGYLGKTVFFDTVVLDYMVSDPSILGLSKTDVSTIELFKSAYAYLGTLPLAADLGTFAADMLIGISNVMNRYNEMRALVEIRSAVIKQMTELRADISDAKELKEIDQLCRLMKNLIYINYRGEYCAHEMLANDAQAYSLAIKMNGQVQTIDRIFENAKEYTRAFVECLALFVFPMEELYKKTADNDPESIPIGKPETIDDAVYFNGHYYKVYNGQPSWEDAAAFCQSVGGHLATITSEEENTFLYDYLVSLGLNGAYFGFSDVNMEGNWVWCTDEEGTFTNWDSGEPNNEGRKEHYGLFDFSHNDGKWNDGSYRSGTEANFVCEWDAVVSPDTGNNGSTKTVCLLKQAVTYNVDYDNLPSKTKTFQYNQDGQLTGVTIETVSKRIQYGETSYEEQLLEYNLECNELGYYSGFSASLDGSYSGKGTITCDENGRIVEFYSSETGQKYSFSYNVDGSICEYIYEYNGEIYVQSTMQYDSRGNVVVQERIQRNGSKSEALTDIEYDLGDGLIEKVQYVDGVEQGSILQRCDTRGNVMKQEYYKDGVLTGWIEYVYEERPVPDSWQKLPDFILSLLGG